MERSVQMRCLACKGLSPTRQISRLPHTGFECGVPRIFGLSDSLGPEGGDISYKNQIRMTAN